MKLEMKLEIRNLKLEIRKNKFPILVTFKLSDQLFIF